VILQSIVEWVINAPMIPCETPISPLSLSIAIGTSLSLSSLSLSTLPFDRLSLSYKKIRTSPRSGLPTQHHSYLSPSLSLSKQFAAAAEQPRKASARREGEGGASESLGRFRRPGSPRTRDRTAATRRLSLSTAYVLSLPRPPPSPCSPPPSSPVAIAAGIPD